MKVENFARAHKLIEDREEIIKDFGSLSLPNWLGVTFRGSYQNKEVVELVKPVLERYLNEKRWGIEEELKQLGVDF